MAIALVSNTTVAGTTGGTTAAINTTGATLLVVVVAYNTGGTPTVSDSKSNTWTGLTAKDSGTEAVRLFYVANPTVGTGHTFTVAGGTLYQSMCVSAWSGVTASSPFDVQNGATSASATSLATGSVTPSVNNELVIAGLAFTAVNTISINSGATIVNQINLSAGVNYGSALAYIVQTTAAAINPTWSWGSATSCSAAIATFKEAAGSTAKVLVIAGGGGGGSVGGGGGAGGYQYNAALTIALGAYAVTVGAGGAGGAPDGSDGTDGSNSVFSSITATGGGAGAGNVGTNGHNGGSGGGGRSTGGASSGGTGSQGNNGGGSASASPNPSGGGGGASAVGGTGATTVSGGGGVGTANSITGTSVTYAGGGSGCWRAYLSGTGTAPGAGGGGAGTGTSATATAGTPNTGGGGGGAGFDGALGRGGAGGSGVVIISYVTGTLSATGGTVTIVGSETIHRFTSSGTFTSSTPVPAYETSVTIAGVEYGARRLTAGLKVLVDSLVIDDYVDHEPSRCQVTAFGFKPIVGQEIVANLGSSTIFGGYVSAIAQRYESKTTNIFYDASAVDYTWGLNRRQVLKKYSAQSATAIAQDLISTYCPGFTAVNVVADLPTVDEITFTYQNVTDALTQLASRIGGYWFLDYTKDLHFFLTDATIANPTDLTSSHPTLSHLTSAVDLSQVVTRAIVEGGGATAEADCAVGETMIPVENGLWYAELGGAVVVGQQKLTYTGRTLGGGGSLVGLGIGPSSAPTVAVAAGAGITVGAHGYAVTFVTGAGESLPSPTVSITTGVTPPPTVAPAINREEDGDVTDGYHKYAYTFVTAAGETTASPLSVQVHTEDGGDDKGYSEPDENTFVLSGIQLGPSGVTSRKIYRTAANASQLKLLATISDNTTTTYRDEAADAALGANVPTTNGATASQVSITNIPIGSATVTQRKVYRTAAAGSQLKLLTTIANNTATTYTDSTADGSLGANVPTSDTSGLTQGDGQVVAGSTSLAVAGPSSFSSTGGWAIIGNGQQAVRYTGVSASALTGIPATGSGSITASVSYNSTVTASPAITGIPSTGTGSVLYPILKGESVNVLATVDDIPAQNVLGALLSNDGIQEDHTQDQRLSLTEAIARGTVILQLRSSGTLAISYRCRDVVTAAGATITVNLAAPTDLAATLQIQHVQISQFDPQARFAPTYDVQASSSRFSFEDLLRRART